MGRIFAVKIKVLPKFLFIFKIMIMVISQKWLLKIQQMLNNFIWNGRKGRITFSMMQTSVEKVGLAVQFCIIMQPDCFL